MRSTSSSNQTCEVRLDRAHNMIRVTFAGHLSEENGEEGAIQFHELLDGEVYGVVFDVQEMTSYDSGAVSAWQEILEPHRREIAFITFVGGTSFIRVGGRLLGLSLGIPVSWAPALEPGSSTALVA